MRTGYEERGQPHLTVTVSGPGSPDNKHLGTEGREVLALHDGLLQD
jgi:hypothetical protein